MESSPPPAQKFALLPLGVSPKQLSKIALGRWREVCDWDRFQAMTAQERERAVADCESELEYLASRLSTSRRTTIAKQILEVDRYNKLDWQFFWDVAVPLVSVQLRVLCPHFDLARLDTMRRSAVLEKPASVFLNQRAVELELAKNKEVDRLLPPIPKAPPSPSMHAVQEKSEPEPKRPCLVSLLDQQLPHDPEGDAFVGAVFTDP